MTARVLQLLALALLLASCAQKTIPPVESGDAMQTYTASDVQKALQDAEQFRREGKYEQALERHIWYHENALRYAPAHGGVRLSFALSDWADLAKVYPKALDALKATRDKAVAAYRKDPSDALRFQEAMSINFAINDLPSAKALFYEGRPHGAPSLLTLELDRIIDAGDLKWAKDVIGDPNEAFQKILDDHDMTRSIGKGNKDIEEGLDSLFSSQAAKLIRAVSKVDGPAAARTLQKRALQHLDSPEIRNAIR